VSPLPSAPWHLTHWSVQLVAASAPNAASEAKAALATARARRRREDFMTGGGTERGCGGARAGWPAAGKLSSKRAPWTRRILAGTVHFFVFSAGGCADFVRRSTANARATLRNLCAARAHE